MPKLEYRRLSPAEIEEEVGGLNGWSVAETLLIKTFEFDSYQKGLVFATAVGYLGDKMDHHPDMQIGYLKVSIALTTHAADGISPYDIELARRIDSLLG
ncbi:MAG TPA: 4a-hydroxytetrahydrobiopterin dehydratase [Fimbriimonas sp.]|nr:4a-hydroxytetrahydrobiopterin dehydratase [Fimbriimonas sp.]